jgi:hypothetical protein
LFSFIVTAKCPGHLLHPFELSFAERIRDVLKPVPHEKSEKSTHLVLSLDKGIHLAALPEDLSFPSEV